MSDFKQLGLSEDILKVLSELGFADPTEIQEQAIPQLLKEYKDFIGLAQTGTGKTAAFGLPLLERIDPFNNCTQGLVLAPTRELGQQIAEQLNKFSKYLDKVNVLPVYGGAAISNQIKALRKTQHVIIATPGRLIDLIERKAINLNQLQFLILDEADEMLNMGFKEELDKILSHTPSDKLTWLFSATMPNEIKRIVKKYMADPLEVKVNTQNEVNANIEHQYTIVTRANKSEALTRFLDVNADMRGLVFCRTKRDTQDLAEQLLKKNYKADALHGDLSQAQRDRVMKRFKAHHLQVLIATDVAARGIDVNDLTHVFHYTLPDDNSYYTHRSGRTARAGKKGISIAFINGRENSKIKQLERQLDISFTKVLIPNTTDISDRRIESWCTQILEKNTGRIDPNLLEKANTLFGNLSKEDLIAKVLAGELEKLNIGSTKDLNDSGRSSREGGREDRNHKRRKNDREPRNRNDRRDNYEPRTRDGRKDRDNKRSDREQRNKNEKPRFFINIGSKDKVSKSELMDFICRIGKLKKSALGSVDIKTSYSFFEVESSVQKKLADKFRGIVLEDGRALRVNRDN